MAYAENYVSTPQGGDGATGTEQSDKKTQSDKMRDTAASAQESVKQTAENVRASAANAVGRGSDQAYAVQSEFDDAVRRNPTLAVIGALGLGIALGLAMNKRG